MSSPESPNPPPASLDTLPPSPPVAGSGVPADSSADAPSGAIDRAGEGKLALPEAAPNPAPPPPTKPSSAETRPAQGDAGPLLKKRFPALFGGAPKPLKLRIQIDIQERAPGVFTKQALSAFFRRYTGSTSYLQAVAQGKQRLDLDGQPAGEISDEHRRGAIDELARRRALHDERRELEAQQRRNRAGLLRDFERTTLTRANFCVLKQVADEELDGLLERARHEALEDRDLQARRHDPRAPAPRHGRGPDSRDARGQELPRGPRSATHPHDPRPADPARRPRPPQAPRDPRSPGPVRNSRPPDEARGERPAQPARGPRPPEQPRAHPAEPSRGPRAREQSRGPHSSEQASGPRPFDPARGARHPDAARGPRPPEQARGPRPAEQGRGPRRPDRPHDPHPSDSRQGSAPVDAPAAPPAESPPETGAPTRPDGETPIADRPESDR